MWSSQSGKVWLGLVVVSTVVACGQPVTRDGATGPATGAGADEVLYVLDPNGESLTSRVVRIDPRTQRVERSYPAGYDPALALSPDGTRLYVASARQHGDELTDALVVVDTTSGKVLSTTPVEDRWEGAGVPTHQSLAPSPDGLWLYVLQARLTGGAGVDGVVGSDGAGGVGAAVADSEVVVEVVEAPLPAPVNGCAQLEHQRASARLFVPHDGHLSGRSADSVMRQPFS